MSRGQITLCPTCGQPRPLKKKRRKTCSLCGQPMGRKDKWRVGDDDRLQHKDCANPTMDVEEKQGGEATTTPLFD